MNDIELERDRELIGRIIVNNLKKYGSIEPQGFNNGLPTHGTGDDIAPMSHANYLRTAAYLRQNSPTNPHFVSLAEAKDLKLGIKKGARPLYLEEWYGSVEHGYDYMLRPYYNVTDLVGTHERIKPLLSIVQPNKTDCIAKFAQEIHYDDPDKESYVSGDFGYDLLQKYLNQYKLTDSESYTGLANHLRDMVEKNVAESNDTVTPLISHILLKEYHLLYGDIYSAKPMYDKSIIEYYDKNPLFLFSDITVAKKIIKDEFISPKTQIKDLPHTDTINVSTTPDVVSTTQEESSDESINAPTQENGITEEKGLTVTVYNLNSHLDLSKYKKQDDEYTLTDDTAFEFLHKILYLDIAYFNDKSHYENHNGDFEFKIDYGLIHSSFSGQLGTLYFRENEMFSDFLRDYLKTPDSINEIASFTAAEKKCLPTKSSNIPCVDLKIDFQHPQKAKLYIYLCQKQDIPYIEPYILREAADEKLKSYCVIPASKSKEIFNDLATIGITNDDYLTERNGLPNNFYAFVSAYHPTHMKDTPTLLAVKADDVKAIQSISRLSVDLKETSLLKGTLQADRVHGIDSLMRILLQREADTAAFYYAVSSTSFNIATQPKVSMQINVDDNPITEFNYIIGENCPALFEEARNVSTLATRLGTVTHDNALADQLINGINAYAHYHDSSLVANFNKTYSNTYTNYSTGKRFTAPPSPDRCRAEWESIFKKKINTVREWLLEIPMREIQENEQPIPSVPFSNNPTTIVFNMFMNYASYSPDIQTEAELYKATCQKMIDYGLADFEIYKAIPYCKQTDFIMSCFDKVTKNSANKEKLAQNYEAATKYYNKKGLTK